MYSSDDVMLGLFVKQVRWQSEVTPMQDASASGRTMCLFQCYNYWSYSVVACTD